MKFKVNHIDPKFSCTFESEVLHDNNDYGNGNYISVRRNGIPFVYLDCRYAKIFDEKRLVTKYLLNFYGKNAKSIEVVS